jgi:uncharacterized protein (TIGR00369 family)
MSTDNTIPVERLTAAQIDALFRASPFMDPLGFKVLDLDYDRLQLRVHMPLLPALERRPGTKQFHGGAIAALIDVTGDFAIGMMVGGGVPTINLRIDYLKPAVGEGLTATAVVRRRGKTVAFVDIDVCDERDALVAMGRGLYSPNKG